MAKRKPRLSPQSQLPPTLEQGWLQKWFRDSETILLARLTQVTGFLVVAIGGIDWNRLFSLDFSHGFNQQTLIFGSLALIQGIFIELARRRRGSNDLIQ